MSSLSEPDAERRFLSGRVACLATVTPAGHPHVVPITFAPGGRDTLVSAVDHKPKRTEALARLTHIAANPTVSLLVNLYDDDWSQLWWARADGHAEILGSETQTRARHAAVEHLVERYPQYAERPPQGPVIVITVARWTGWSYG